MKVLALESCNRLSLGLFVNNNIVDKIEFLEKDIADILIIKIKEFLQVNHIKPLDLDGIAVVVGPGSFTGIRAVVLVAKMLRLILKIPVISINSLNLLHQEVLNFNKFNDDDIILCTINVGNSGIALAIFDNKQNQIEQSQFVLLDDLENFLLKYNKKNIYIVGSAQDKVKFLDKNLNLIYLDTIFYPNIDYIKNFFNNLSSISLNDKLEPLYITQPSIIIKNYGLK